MITVAFQLMNNTLQAVTINRRCHFVTVGSAESFGASASVAVIRVLVAVAFTRPKKAVGTGSCRRDGRYVETRLNLKILAPLDVVANYFSRNTISIRQFMKGNLLNSVK